MFCKYRNPCIVFNYMHHHKCIETTNTIFCYFYFIHLWRLSLYLYIRDCSKQLSKYKNSLSHAYEFAQIFFYWCYSHWKTDKNNVHDLYDELDRTISVWNTFCGCVDTCYYFLHNNNVNPPHFAHKGKVT